MRQTRPKIEFIPANVAKCICPKCPVQSKSVCAMSKMGNIADSLKKNPMQHEDIPGVYCAAGTSTCDDLDLTQTCICITCAVFKENDLASGTPVGYYCRDGRAR